MKQALSLAHFTDRATEVQREKGLTYSCGLLVSRVKLRVVLTKLLCVALQPQGWRHERWNQRHR